MTDSLLDKIASLDRRDQELSNGIYITRVLWSHFLHIAFRLTTLGSHFFAVAFLNGSTVISCTLLLAVGED